jgi:hypothetical protein
VYWSSIATGCVPTGETIQGDVYANPNDTIVAPRGTKLDPIVLICGVEPNTGAASPNVLSMTYLDSSGANRKAFVQAQLIRVNRKNGNRSVAANLRSDSSDVTTTQKIHASFSGGLDFERFYYFVRVMIDRSERSQIVRSIGIALEAVAP